MRSSPKYHVELHVAGEEKNRPCTSLRSHRRWKRVCRMAENPVSTQCAVTVQIGGLLPTVVQSILMKDRWQQTER